MKQVHTQVSGVPLSPLVHCLVDALHTYTVYCAAAETSMRHAWRDSPCPCVGEYLQPAFDALSPAGRLVVFGAAALTPSPATDLSLGWRTLAPSSLLGIARLIWGWLQRPRIDALKLPGEGWLCC